MLTKVITTIEELETLREDWQSLLKHVEQPEIFDYWEWNRAYLRNVLEDRAHLFILAVYDLDKCVGIAPLMVSTKKRMGTEFRVLHPINPQNKDYCSFYIHREYRYVTVFKQFMDEITRFNSDWDYMQLMNFSSKNQITFLAQSMLANTFDLYSEEAVVVPYVNLHSLTSLKTNASHLKSIEQNESKLRHEHQIEITVNGKFDEQVYQRMIKLQGKRSQHSHWQNPKYSAFYRELSQSMEQQGQLEFSYLKINGVVAAAHLGFNTEQKTYYYIPLLDPKMAQAGVDLILLKHMMKHYQAEGKAEFDFLRGDESFKFYWADNVAMNYRLHIFNDNGKMKIMKRLIKSSIYLRRFKDVMKGFRTIKNVHKVPMARGAEKH